MAICDRIRRNLRWKVRSRGISQALLARSVVVRALVRHNTSASEQAALTAAGVTVRSCGRHQRRFRRGGVPGCCQRNQVGPVSSNLGASATLTEPAATYGDAQRREQGERTYRPTMRSLVTTRRSRSVTPFAASRRRCPRRRSTSTTTTRRTTRSSARARRVPSSGPSSCRARAMSRAGCSRTSTPTCT